MSDTWSEPEIGPSPRRPLRVQAWQGTRGMRAETPARRERHLRDRPISMKCKRARPHLHNSVPGFGERATREAAAAWPSPLHSLQRALQGAETPTPGGRRRAGAARVAQPWKLGRGAGAGGHPASTSPQWRQRPVSLRTKN